MAIDGGVSGIEQSRHHPNAGLSAQRPSTDNEAQKEKTITEKVDELKGKINSLVDQEKVPLLGGLINELLNLRVADALAARPRCPCNEDTTPVTMGGLRAALKEHQKTEKKTWASVASTALRQRPGPVPTEARAIIPTRRTREIIIKSKDQPPEMQNRTPKEIVQAANTAIGPPLGNAAIAARTLPSGDIILTFKDDAEKYTKDVAWVQKTFGDQAEVKGREIAVHISGLPSRQLRGISDEDFATQLQDQSNPSIQRARKQIPKDPEARHATAVIHVRSAEAAMELCAQGVVWEAQIFQCSPYKAELKLTQCFKCYKFGHIAAHCKAEARCGGCGAAAHERGGKEGENQCPQKKTDGTFALMSCCNCGEKHTAWDRRCKVAVQEKKRIQAAYAVRPRQFELGSRTAPSKSVQTGANMEAVQGWNHIMRRREARSRGGGRGNSRARGRSASTARSKRPRLESDADNTMQQDTSDQTIW